MCVSLFQTFCFIPRVYLFRHHHHTVSLLMNTFDDLPWPPVLLLRPLLSKSPSLYLLFFLLQLKLISSVSSHKHRTPFVHVSLSCQVLWALSFYVNAVAAFWPRGDSLSLTALTADFTSNLLSLSSTAESCKCHYHFCHHHHRQKHQPLPFLHLLFRANEVAADVQNQGFICRVSKVIIPCRSVHVLKVSHRPGERLSYTTYSL